MSTGTHHASKCVSSEEKHQLLAGALLACLFLFAIVEYNCQLSHGILIGASLEANQVVTNALCH
eukprot:2758896-Rhodomonas_salina.2